MDRFPKYSFGTWAAAVLGMCHLPALAIAVVFLVTGLVTIGRFPWTSGILLSFPALIAATQVVSRVRFIRGLSAIRPFEGGVEVFHGENRRWYPGSLATSLTKKDFAYADPWRPITVGFPGIEIGLKGVSTPAEVLFPYGLEEHRDRVFAHLEKLFAGMVASDSEREGGP